MAALADLVGLANPACELVVELVGCADPELVHEQALGVGRRSADPWVLDAPLQVQVPVKTAAGGLGAGESAPTAFERDPRLGDRVVEGAACLDQLDEALVERDDSGWLAVEMVFDGPQDRLHMPQHNLPGCPGTALAFVCSRVAQPQQRRRIPDRRSVISRPRKPASVLRVPRPTLRTRLTLLYAGPFVASGAALLTIPILQTKQTVPAGSPGSAGRAPHATNLHRRLSLSGRDDEFKELAETLDDLFERLQTSFASQRHFVANASHELRTPLTAERTLLQVALADPGATAETLRSTCQDALALGEQQERLIEALLTLASSERGIERREPFDLADIAGTVVLARRQEAQRRGIHVDTALATAPAAGDPNLVASLVANLVDNALRHNAAGGRIEIATTTTAGQASITVKNTGTAVPPNEVQPFRQLGSQRIRHTDGHGLGLAIVRAIASAPGATLIPRARPEGGLDIEVSFPTHERYRAVGRMAPR